MKFHVPFYSHSVSSAEIGIRPSELNFSFVFFFSAFYQFNFSISSFSFPILYLREEREKKTRSDTNSPLTGALKMARVMLFFFIFYNPSTLLNFRKDMRQSIQRTFGVTDEYLRKIHLTE